MAPNRRKSRYSSTTFGKKKASSQKERGHTRRWVRNQSTRGTEKSETQKLRQQKARTDEDAKYGPHQGVKLEGVPRSLAIRSSGAAAPKYYFLIPVTDVLARALKPVPDQSSLLVKGMWLQFVVFHKCDVELDVLMVGTPTNKRKITVCEYFHGPFFPTVSVGDDSIPKQEEDDFMMSAVKKEYDTNLLDANNPVVRQLVCTAFGGLPGRDGSYFSASLEKSMKTFKGKYAVNRGRARNHNGRVREAFSHRPRVGGGTNTSRASRRSFRFWWEMGMGEEMQIRENGKSVPDTYYAVLCGVRPVSTLAKYDEDGEASMVAWVENVRTGTYYQVPKGP